MVFPSGKKSCSTRSSSVQWRTTLASSLNPPLTLISVNRRCFSPSVFALLPVHLVTLVTSKRFDSKLADVGSALFTQLGRYLGWPSVDPGPVEQGARLRQLGLATRKRRPCRHTKSCLLALFDYPAWSFFYVFFFPLSCKANARV